MRRIRITPASLIVSLIFAIIIIYISLPVVSLFIKTSPESFISSLNEPVVIEALKLSFLTTIATTIIVIIIGTPVAFINARYRYPGKELVDTLLDLPVVMPPAVAGIALLMAFGRKGVLGEYLNLFGVTLAFTTIAVVMAQVFVASPFFIRQARTSFEDVDRSFENAARSLGASRVYTFFYITVPIAMNGLISGAIMTWARALGEFGATIMFAGNFQGRTQTMPLAIYTAMQGDIDASLFLSIVLVITSFTVIAIVKILTRRRMIVAKD
ncbi:molybdate ABC transporter permease subunit [Methanocella sp. CWC-04]|uniref:Molybdate ABC transporter permease subunit n=2 Tax=Methanooceanicella nereidis TaxID=2052831 RepID=A0AAP2RB64_9EURY|nr:molybdate ABC transporter permease subunit [Methanocella sp. CWC-04]